MNIQARATLCGLLAVLLSGCISTGEEGLPITTTMAPAPAPKVVSTLHVEACPPNGVPVQTAPLSQRFIVEEGFDRIVIEYGETGEGTVTPSIRFVEENKEVWGGDQRQVNTAPTACGQHGSHGPGEEIDVEPGEYESRIQYAGAVDITLTITARSSRNADMMHSDH